MLTATKIFINLIKKFALERLQLGQQ